MTPLESAILDEQNRVNSFGQGTAKQPQFGTSEYFSLRAAAVGLAFLQTLQSQAADNSVAACESIYKRALGEAKNA